MNGGFNEIEFDESGNATVISSTSNSSGEASKCQRARYGPCGCQVCQSEEQSRRSA